MGLSLKKREFLSPLLLAGLVSSPLEAVLVSKILKLSGKFCIKIII